jgi:hypothetical protein
MMHLDQQKEQFSKAFVYAVATIAGYGTYQPEVDDDSVDLGIAARSSANTPRRPRLELQLKCTYVDEGDDHFLAYDLKLKNYEDLRADTIVPRILVVVLAPQDVNSWLEVSDHEMCLRHCAYWLSLNSLPATNNAHKVRVKIPRSAKFTPQELQRMMVKINNGEIL